MYLGVFQEGDDSEPLRCATYVHLLQVWRQLDVGLQLPSLYTMLYIQATDCLTCVHLGMAYLHCLCFCSIF